MEKELKRYKTDLLIIFICYVITILSNMSMFFLGVIPFLYGVSLMILASFTLYSHVLVNNDTKKSMKIVSVLGPLIVIAMFVGDFIYLRNIIENFRIAGWVYLIGGISVTKTARKLKNSF